MYNESVTGYTLTAFVLVVGACICLLLGRQLAIRPEMTLAIYTWHTICGIVFYLFILSDGGDPLAYFQRAKYEYISLTYGTEFVVWLTSIPVELGFSFLSTSMLYNIIGAAALLVFHASLRDAVYKPGRFSGLLVLICTFLPSVSFWTSGIGKDAIAFLAVAFFVRSSVQLERRFLLMIAAIVLMFTVRPHIAALMIVSIPIGTLFIRKLHGSLRMTFGLMALLASSVAVPFALLYAGTENLAGLESFVEKRETSFQKTGSSIDISGLNPILRVPSFIFRPLPQEANGSAQLASAIENLILILIAGFAIIGIIRAGFGAVFGRYAIHIIYGVAGVVILSQVIPNLGLAARQKWMMLPPLLILTVGAWSLVRERETTGQRGAVRQITPFREAR